MEKEQPGRHSGRESKLVRLEPQCSKQKEMSSENKIDQEEGRGQLTCCLAWRRADEEEPLHRRRQGDSTKQHERK